MTIPQLENISSIEALASSIKTDPQVYRWFTFLIVQPAVKSKLASDENVKKLYAELKTIISKQRILYLSLLGFLLIIAFSRYYSIFLAAIIFLYLCIKFHLRKKQCVAQISTRMISGDFEDSILCKTTLYQMCESYSQKYNIPSLVDTIYHSDNILRYAIFSALVLNIIWTQRTDWQFFLVLFLSYHIINAISKTNIIYRHLK